MLYIYLLCSFLLNPTSSSQPLGWLVSSVPSSYLPTVSYVVLLLRRLLLLPTTSFLLTGTPVHSDDIHPTGWFIFLYNFSHVIVCTVSISLTWLFVVFTTSTIYLLKPSLSPTERHHLRETRINRTMTKSELTTHCVSNLCGILLVVPTCGLSLVGSLFTSVTLDTINNQRHNLQTGYWLTLFILPLFRGGFYSFYSLRCSFHSLLFVGMWHPSLSLMFDRVFPP